jgi:hypothetical protein
MKVDVITIVENVKFTLTGHEARLLKLLCMARTNPVAESIRNNGYYISDEKKQELTSFMQDLFNALESIKITNGDL